MVDILVNHKFSAALFSLILLIFCVWRKRLKSYSPNYSKSTNIRTLKSPKRIWDLENFLFILLSVSHIPGPSGHVLVFQEPLSTTTSQKIQKSSCWFSFSYLSPVFGVKMGEQEEIKMLLYASSFPTKHIIQKILAF